MSDSALKIGFGYHPELQGIRAAAVLVVWVSHIHIQGIQGSGIGVDVFFALSGVLITSLLLIERAQTGSIDLRGFYLYHYPVIPVLGKYVERQAAVMVLSLVITFVLVEVSWRLVEAPALALKHRFARGPDDKHDGVTSPRSG